MQQQWATFFRPQPQDPGQACDIGQQVSCGQPCLLYFFFFLVSVKKLSALAVSFRGHLWRRRRCMRSQEPAGRCHRKHSLQPSGEYDDNKLQVSAAFHAQMPGCLSSSSAPLGCSHSGVPACLISLAPCSLGTLDKCLKLSCTGLCCGRKKCQASEKAGDMRQNRSTKARAGGCRRRAR